MNGARGRRKEDRRTDEAGKRRGKRTTGRASKNALAEFIYFTVVSKETSASTGRKVSPARPPTVSSATRTWRQRHGHGEWIRVIENHWSFKLATRRCHYRVDLPAPSLQHPHSLVSPLTRLPPHPTALFILFSRMVRFFLSLSLSLSLSLYFVLVYGSPPTPLSFSSSKPSLTLSLSQI